jgi:hypothetical protein
MCDCPFRQVWLWRQGHLLVFLLLLLEGEDEGEAAGGHCQPGDVGQDLVL